MPNVMRLKCWWPLRAQLIVETVGPDSYVVGCGAPLACTVGMVDACRISGDGVLAEP